MTTADSSYDDIYDTPVEVHLRETLIRLEGLRGWGSIHQLPSGSDQKIVEALRLNARLIRTGSERPSTGTISIVRIFSPIGRTTVALRLVGAMVAISIVISSVFIFGGVASRPPTPVSAAALVLSRAARFSVGQGQYAQFTYDVGFGGGLWGRPITGGDQIWVRGRSSLGPEVEAASVGIPSIRVRDGQLGGYGGWELVIGDAAYQGANDVPEYAFPGPLYAFYMSPVNQLNSDPIAYVLSHGGAQTARFLEQSLGRSRAIAAHYGILDGHRVDVVTVKHWPGQRTGALALYFDRKTHLLRRLDGRGLGRVAPHRRWSIRLVHAQMAGARRAWSLHLHLMLGYLNAHHPAVYHNGRPLFGLFVPIQIQLSSVADLRDVCPGIRHLDADLWAGMGALGACRTVVPNMTANQLVSAMTAWDRNELAIGIRERIFSHSVVSASLSPFTRGLLSDFLRSERARKAWARSVQQRFRRGRTPLIQALNELL